MVSLVQSLRRKPVLPEPSNMPDMAVAPAGLPVYGSNSDEAALKTPEYVSTLFAALDVRGKSVASADWELHRIVGRGRTRTPIEAHPALSVLNRPNSLIRSRSTFIRSWQQHLDLTGKAFVAYGYHRSIPWPVSIHIVRPDRVAPIPGKGTQISHYEFRAPDGTVAKFTTKEMDFWRLPHPTDPLDGLSPVESIITELQSFKLAGEWQRNFFVNSARPGGTVTFKEYLSKEDFEEQKEMIQSQHQGVNNAHRMMLLQNAEYNPSTFRMSDMQFPELRQNGRDFILEALGMPRTFLGQGTEVNRASAQALSEIYDENQRIPALNELAEFLNGSYLPKFDERDLCFEPVLASRRSVEDEATERDSKYAAASSMVEAGFDPASVLEVLELPEMDYVGRPDNGSTTV